MEVENWKPVVGFEGLYEVSDLGRVRALETWTRRGRSGGVLKAHERKPVKDPRGYLRMILYTHHDENGYRKESAKFIHQLVAFAFIGPPPEGKCSVNHKDFDRTNNSVGNLEWVSPAENVAHSARAGRLWAENAPKQSKYTEDQIRSVKQHLAEGVKSRAEIAEATGVTVSTVSSVILGRSWTFGSTRGKRTVAGSPWEQPGRRRKLTPSDVLSIRSLKGTASAAKIGKQFGVSAPVIWGILNNKYWKDPDIT